MLRLQAIAWLLLLVLLSSVASAQRTLYCDTSSPVAVTDRDFYLVTRPSGAASYSQGLTCEFSATADAAFLVEVESVRVGTAVLTISSGDQVLFSGSSVPAHQSSMVTPSKSLKVRFDATGDHSSNKAGVKIRVRALDTNGCPPGWAYLLGNCYGTSNTSSYQDYLSAQTACNNMRSNLLQVPAAYLNKIGDFMRMLPQHLRQSYTWVGLTDRVTRFSHYWLSGASQLSTGEISCVSNGIYLTCYTNERCGSIYDRSTLYAIYMGDCTRLYRYACSMPPGGAFIYYAVPGPLAPVFIFSDQLILAIVAASVLVIGLIIIGIYHGVRRYRAHRAAGAASSGFASPGQVTSGSYPMQPQNSAASPADDGNVNSGYAN